VTESLAILRALGLPKAQCNERSGLCLLALLGIKKSDTWADATRPMLGITPIMKWIETQGYREAYAPNTRETIRRQTIHQFMQAGLLEMNPGGDKAVNAPGTVYQITKAAHEMLRTYGTHNWDRSLGLFLKKRTTLVQRIEHRRRMSTVPLTIPGGGQMDLSPGAHSELIKAIIEEFGPRFAPNGIVLYVGDTGKKWHVNETERFIELGVQLDEHGKMPDVVIHFTERGWLILAEAVTSHGPVDPKRHDELKELFQGSTAGLVFLTAFPSRAKMTKYLKDISWETEVWCADAPDHLIHFNGERFLGPY
jgi:hypothetical protein